jgi:hypothetical protein
MVGAVIDKCGGPTASVIDEHTVLGELKASLDLADLEISQSERGHARFYFEAELEAETREGNISAAPGFSGANVDAIYEVVSSDSPPVFEIPIYEDIEDIIRAEREGRRAIMLTNADSTGYFLSWMPAAAVPVVVWSKRPLFSITGSTLDDNIELPTYFDSMIINRAALKVLDYLLSPEVPRDWTRFVSSRKQSIIDELNKFELRWENFRMEVPDDGATLVRQFYDPLEDMMRM